MARFKFWLFAATVFGLAGYALVVGSRHAAVRAREAAAARVEANTTRIGLLDRQEAASLALLVQKIAQSPAVQDLARRRGDAPLPPDAATVVRDSARPLAEAGLGSRLPIALFLIGDKNGFASVRGDNAPVFSADPSSFGLAAAASPGRNGTLQAVGSALYRIAAVEVRPPAVPRTETPVTTRPRGRRGASPVEPVPAPAPQPFLIGVAVPAPTDAWSKALGVELVLTASGISSGAITSRAPPAASPEDPLARFKLPLFVSHSPDRVLGEAALLGVDAKAQFVEPVSSLERLAWLQKRVLAALGGLLLLALVITALLRSPKGSPTKRAQPAAPEANPTTAPSVAPTETAPATAPPGVPTLAPPAESKPIEAEERAELQDLFERFVAMRASLGEPTEGIDADRFIERMRKTRQELCAKYGCTALRFEVAERQGRAAIRGIPVRTTKP